MAVGVHPWLRKPVQGYPTISGQEQTNIGSEFGCKFANVAPDANIARFASVGGHGQRELAGG